MLPHKLAKDSFVRLLQAGGERQQYALIDQDLSPHTWQNIEPTLRLKRKVNISPKISIVLLKSYEKDMYTTTLRFILNFFPTLSPALADPIRPRTRNLRQFMK